MKKTVLAGLFALMGILASAEKYHANVIQNVAIPGGQYAVDVPAPTISFSTLPNGKLNLRYDFNLDAKKDAEDKLIDCKIQFLNGVSYLVTAFAGIAGFDIEGEQVPALMEKNTYVEFLIPVRKEGKGFIEIQLSLTSNDVGSDIPIKVNFTGYQKNKESLAFRIIGNAVGGNLFALGAYLYTGTSIYTELTEAIETEINIVKAAEIEAKFEIIKDKYKDFSLSGSLKQFRVQVR